MNLLGFNEKIDTCNFADDNTLHSCVQFINEASETLHNDLKIVSKWFGHEQPKDGKSWKIPVHDFR